MSDIKEKFYGDGYVVLEGFLTDQEADQLKAEGDNLIKNMPPPSDRATFSTVDSKALQNKNRFFLESCDKVRYFYEVGALDDNGELKVAPEVSLNKIGHSLHELNPTFKKFTVDERVKETCFQLGFEDPIVVQSMYIFKNPGLGSEVITHQDSSYLHTEPVKLVGFWFALEDATTENGCLWFSKGSHTSGIHRRYIRNPDKDSDELLIYTTPPPNYQKSSFTPMPVKKGTCVLIHGQVVHYSEPNKSSKSRHAYTFHVADNKTTTWSKENWVQPPEGRNFMSLYRN